MAEKTAAIILAGGKGSRMQSDVHKQYIKINDKPILYYTLKAFEASAVDALIIVCGKGEIDFCRREIVEKYHINKVTVITEGGKERYNSVYEGLKKVSNAEITLIHDGARPFVTCEMIQKNIEAARQYRACITAVRSKDTIKISDADGIVQYTPDRRYVWNVQTPQTFQTALIREAYEKLMQQPADGITDDAMVVETVLKYPVKIVEGNYTNLKITTPEDLPMAQILVDNLMKKHNI